jgi:hypothetical protein
LAKVSHTIRLNKRLQKIFSMNPGINVSARKKGFEIEMVEVIVNDEGQVVEQGKARKKKMEDWSNKTTRSLKDTAKYQILVRARERTGNYVNRKVYRQKPE